MGPNKHRPIVMNRNKKPGRTAKIVRRALVITAILAFIEIIILVVIHYKDTGNALVKTKDKPAEFELTKQQDIQQKKTTIGQGVKSNTSSVVLQPTKVLPENRSLASTTKKDTNYLKQNVAEQMITGSEKHLQDTAILPGSHRREIETVKKISDSEMFQILNDVRIEKMQANNWTKCVTIKIVNNSNAKNGSKIANYLRKNGYSISGREVINGTLRGIQINATGACIQLTIGTL